MNLSKRVVDMNSDEPRYHLIRAALTMMDKPLSELNEDEYKKVEQQAYRELAIEQKVLSSNEAAAVIVPEKLIEQSVKEIAGRYEDEESFWTALENNGMNKEQLYSAVERDLRVQSAIERITADAWQVSDEDVEIFYQQHKDRFTLPETRTLRHILITLNEEYAENSREQVMERMEDIHKRLTRKPKSFDKIAQKHSECPTALHGGLLGRVPKGQLYAELEAVAFEMKSGEISRPVESELGLHILYCEEIHPEGVVDYKEVRKKLKAQLQQRYDRIWLRNWLK